MQACKLAHLKLYSLADYDNIDISGGENTVETIHCFISRGSTAWGYGNFIVTDSGLKFVFFHRGENWLTLFFTTSLGVESEFPVCKVIGNTKGVGVGVIIGTQPPTKGCDHMA